MSLPAASQLDALLDAATADGRVPGVVGVVADPDGLIYEGAAGIADPRSRRPLAVDSIFRLASMTKLITSVAVMQLAEQGAFSLDDEVRSVLPDFDDLLLLEGFDDDGEPRLRPPARRATIRQLLSHTSGLAYEVWNSEILRYYEVTGTPGITSGLRETLSTPLACEPGTRVEYGSGTDWAGLIVEAAGGETLDAYFERFIFGPLGMRDSSVVLSHADRPRCVPVLRREDDGSFTVTDIDYPASPAFYTGGGCVYSTAHDFLTLQRALLAGGEPNDVRILRPATVDEMFRNQIGPLDITILRSAVPFLTNDVDLGPGWKWGIGFCVNELQEPGLRSSGSGGWAGIFNSYFWIDRRAGLAAGLYMQFVPFFDPEALRLLDQFERALYAQRQR